MNKTSVITSLTMLLSVSQYCFTAEAAQPAQPDPEEIALLESQAQEAREKYEQTPTPGRTLFQLERLILSSYPKFKKKGMGTTELSLRALVLGGAIGGGIFASGGAAAAGIANPATALVMGEWMHKCGKIDRHNRYVKRAASTPILSVHQALIDNKPSSILQIEELGMGDDKTTYFNMETFEEYTKKMQGFELDDYVSKGGYEIISSGPEGENRRCTKWEPQRKVYGQIRVTMATPQPPNLSAIKIWKCNGACDPNQSSCNAISCQDFLQTCESPSSDVSLRSFALSLCGQYIALGCTKGAVMILHRNDDIAAGEGWKYSDAFEQRVGQQITPYLADHIRDLKAVKTLSPQEREKLQHALAIEGPPTL